MGNRYDVPVPLEGQEKKNNDCITTVDDPKNLISDCMPRSATTMAFCTAATIMKQQLKRKAQQQYVLVPTVSPTSPGLPPLPPPKRKRAREQPQQQRECDSEVWKGGCSLFLAEPVAFEMPSALTDDERAFMVALCCRRHLPRAYYEGALGLWMRVKAKYPLEQHPAQMIIALHLALKWDSLDLAYYNTKLNIAQEDWPHYLPQLTIEDLLQHELTMCTHLNWTFR